ncbi:MULTISPECIES: CHAT domain-containing protein [unclassified Roseofilum]|uniref:CHAT domain-containing protein n=1 Tax=unclassified Roseofilum TaxID=2620099 RepID=UPI001B1101CA|nr:MULTISPECIES: CHAT domain-containing protein [unclassified Roseofilum]MBP0010382.1 CHAT domain-containing protein [Roseofilum sp. Belize Diploria]MBP0034714.1 CHAT domain-containing protein [Roseofilum sp. Belize BBD 4]
MKIHHFWVGLICIFLILLTHPSLQTAYSQTGNQSDVTGPNLQELLSFPPSESDNSSGSNDNTSFNDVEIAREAFESQFLQSDFEQALQLFEEFQAVEYAKYFDLKLYGRTATLCEIAQVLDRLAQSTQQRSAIIYIVSLQNELNILAIFPKNDACSSPQLLNKQNAELSPFAQIKIQEIPRSSLEETINQFRQEITNPRKVRTTSYEPYASQLYQGLIQPLEVSLSDQKIDTLIFCLDKKIRSLPIAALYHNQHFLIEDYQIGLIPSFSLIDPAYRSVQSATLLGFGVSDGGRNQELPPLPAVPLELSWLQKIWQSQTFLDRQATVENLQEYSKTPNTRMMHIATHAEFRPGDISNSFIQLWDRNVGLDQLRELSQDSQWNQNPRVELLTLSACRTALGSEEAELGFSGLALQAGVKTSLGSLWYTSDEGSLALMAEFYHQLQDSTVKITALRQTQLNMINGSINIRESRLHLSSDLTIDIQDQFSSSQTFNHPYYWSAYTLIGNWN